MDLSDRYHENVLKRIRNTFGLVVISVGYGNKPIFRIATSDYSRYPHHKDHYDHYMHTRSRFFTKETHREFQEELIDQDIPYEINSDGVYVFYQWSAAMEAQAILLSLLFDEGFQFKTWRSL